MGLIALDAVTALVVCGIIFQVRQIAVDLWLPLVNVDTLHVILIAVDAVVLLVICEH